MNRILYAEAHRDCLHDYRSPQGKDTALSVLASNHLADTYLMQLENNGDDGQTMLERALRHLGGRETQGRACPEGALLALAPLLTFSEFDAQSPAINAQAEHAVKADSVAAYAYYKKYTATPEELRMAALNAQRFPLPDRSLHTTDPVESLVRAVYHANRAACVQFISRAVLDVASAFRDLAERLGLDVWSFTQYAPLWRALERRECELFDKKHAGARRDGCILPSQTVCAAPGCIKSLERLKMPCLGNCVWDHKPWYCSSACRTKDWENHRASCKPPRTQPPSALPPAVTLDQRARDIVVRGLSSTGPVTQVEVIPEDVNPLDTRNGIAEWTWEMPSWHVSGKMVQYTLKRYV